MTAKSSQFLNVKYGWDFGEAGWNIGMDENLLKFSIFFDNNIDSIVSSLPPAIANGTSYFLTTDNNVYFDVNGVRNFTSIPKWKILTLRSTGDTWQFDGSTLQLIDSPAVLDSRITSVEAFPSTLSNSSNPAQGAALVGYRNRSLYAALSDEVNVKDFGAVGNGIADDYSAFLAAIAAVQSTGNGGKVRIPAGVYKLNTTLPINVINATTNKYYNLVIEGDGSGNTILDFSGTIAGSDGIAVYGWGGRLGLQGFSVKNAPAVGINFNKGETAGGPNYVHRFYVKDVIADKNGSHGFNFTNTYMASVHDCESRNNGGRGFSLNGFHTSMDFNRCWAGGDLAYPSGGNQGSGWFINGLVYSNFQSCAADWNGSRGYSISNVAGVTITGCGSESNSQEGFYISTSTASASGIPSSSSNINGLTINNCFGFNNSKSGINSYANFLGIVTADSRPVNLSLEGNVDTNTDGTTVSVVVNGTSGAISVVEKENYLSGTYTKSGTFSIQNQSVSGKSILATPSADQSVPNTSDTIVSLNTAFTNRLGATFSSGGVVIPAKVNRVKVTGSTYWTANSTGVRTLTFKKNGLQNTGVSTTTKTALTVATQVTLVTAILEVTQGDVITMNVTQTSGASLNLLANSFTFMSVEAIG